MNDDQMLRDQSPAARAGPTEPLPAATLATILGQRLCASLLPADLPLSPPELAAAADFLIESAQGRGKNRTALVIDTVSGAAEARFMRIAVINEDMPFLVDSVAATIAAHDLEIHRLIHPVIAVARDEAGRILAFPDDADREAIASDDAACDVHESWIYIETRRANARQRAALAEALALTLADVRAAVSDWPAMMVAIGADADRLAALDRVEGAALLRWFQEGRLTQLGAVRHHRDGTEQGALGICRSSAGELLSAESYARAFAWFDAMGPGDRLPLILKSRTRSRVHRRVPLDLFLVPMFEDGPVTADSKVTGLSIHAGVWTSAALAAPPHLVPRLRAQLRGLMDTHGIRPEGHDGKALVHALTKLPHDLIISFSDADLARVTMAMMSLIDRPRPALALVVGGLGRQSFAFVWCPRDALTTRVQAQIAEMLTTPSGARVLDWSLAVEGSNLAQLLFVLDLPAGAKIPDEAALDGQLQAMLRGWSEAVESELMRGGEKSRAAAISARYAEAFPLSYRSTYGPAEAAADIAVLRRIEPGHGRPAEPRAVRLYRLPGDGARQLRLKLYDRTGTLVLSGAVPALENFGFEVIDNFPFRLQQGGTDSVSIHDFLLGLPVGTDPGLVMAHAGIIETAMTAVADGHSENDAFNRLITGAGLSAEAANWLRAWYRYLRQAGMSFGIATVVDALAKAPQVTHGLIDLFTARHCPQQDDAEARAELAIRDGLSAVSAINDDRLLRAFRALILAILRTNAFVPAAAEALAFKFDSALVPGLPRPVPWREIFVYSARVEGVHLRAGPIARGGIRWSDRRDDFRTEVLGLMKAQRVKNAVIVPTGAKGGFYPKQLPDPASLEAGGREAWAAEGRASYQVFIRALLSLTDNIVGGAVVHPAGIRIRDGEDPYFVVAADKGTASFSDTANAIAQAQDFWLDDAFASGGSKGYDHKVMAITARGAWLSVQRHFLEMGVDIQASPVRVVGVGDMSGDVFGNGMLLSQTLKLVAAFDHRHIFLDPNPDPASAWQERSRLFKLPRSSWSDYDRSVLSAGGGVFPRGMKEIALSPEIRAALGITAEVTDPESLITAILTAPVDLLWFGGIGTYVKAASESNAVVGDHANDAVRVDGSAIRARVIGEGANLGCTQAGRIECALSGHLGEGLRNNTDFIDNSAGVDCSDKEVNIKIALAAAKRAGKLSEDGRVEVLVAMTDDVAALVLEDNRLQALALSIAEAGGVAAVASQARLIERLEEGGLLDRVTEGLPDGETLASRANGGRGLTRPELAVLLSTAKLELQAALEQSQVPDDPGLDGELSAAFPPLMRERFADEIAHHRLRREIIATRLCNRLINRIGFVTPFELADEEGASLAEVTAAFIAAEQLFDMAAIWQELETAIMPEAARIRLFAATAEALRSQMADLLRAGAGRSAPTRIAAELAPGVQQLASITDTLLAGEARLQSATMRETFITAGAPAEAAEMVTRLFDMDGAVGLARLARDAGLDAVALTRAFSEIGARLGLDWAQLTAARMSPADAWERLLVAGLARDFQQMRLDFLRHVARNGEPLDDVARWLDGHEAGVRQFRAMVSRAQLVPVTTAAMLAQIASQARALLTR